MDETTSSVGLGDAMLLAQRNNSMDSNSWWIWIFLFFFLMGGNGTWGNNGTQAADLAAAKTQANIWESNDAQSMQQQIRALGNGINDATYALNNTVTGIGENLTNVMTNGFAGVNRDILQGNFGIQQAILGQTNQLGTAMTTGFNGVQRDIMQGFNNTQVQNIQGMNNIAQLMNENRFATQNGFTGVGNAIQASNYENAANTCRITTNSTENTQKILDKLSAMESNAKDVEIANLRSQLQNAQLQVSQYDQNATLVGAIRPFPVPAYTVSSPYGTTGSCPYATA